MISRPGLYFFNFLIIYNRSSRKINFMPKEAVKKVVQKLKTQIFFNLFLIFLIVLVEIKLKTPEAAK